MFASGQRVVILAADHPHRLRTGALVSLDALPGVGPRWKVRLDASPNDVAECYAGEADLEPLGRECPKCGMGMTHYRLRGYQCPACG